MIALLSWKRCFLNVFRLRNPLVATEIFCHRNVIDFVPIVQQTIHNSSHCQIGHCFIGRLRGLDPRQRAAYRGWSREILRTSGNVQKNPRCFRIKKKLPWQQPARELVPIGQPDIDTAIRSPSINFLSRVSYESKLDAYNCSLKS